ncbi:hypothetical protein ACFOG5_05745 [Pedobacter fastidiosus]|uniref:Uncharacterized protein n=1 Tax=Pedobacter fastidiosus TaxID=2765361 RepID=A0ABR7KQP1_9SPHI|nr:hypothetical protein [Pedobacter fastidiosus]MBC6110356.1 hypothetical protein [Pedobacter fastidiosus]
MESIILTNGFKLSFEKLPNTIRLIILKDDEEWVCHKEKLKNLFSFLEVDIKNLFKGRLQLFKFDNRIDIQVKNKHISSISIETFNKH